MLETIKLSAEVPDHLHGDRFDQIAAGLFTDYSRSRLQQWIRDGVLQVNGAVCKPKERLIAGDQLVLNVDVELTPDNGWEAESLALDIVHEDDSILVVNKAAGIVVHPAAGNHSGTLLNGLLHHCPSLQHLPRAGIVHRLDKDTTGLMVIAKTLPAHHRLVRQLQKREVHRQYQAVVFGLMTAGGTVDVPLGRHPVSRKKQAVVADGKEAITHYRVLERFRSHTHVQCRLETGRTHQIRVHMSHIRHPLIGDPLYGGRLHIPANSSPALVEALRGFRRQALHAAELGLIHPDSDEQITWQAPLPSDMLSLLEMLERDGSEQ